MEGPQFKDESTQIFNEVVPLCEMRRVSLRSWLGVYSPVFLVFFGLILVFLNNLSVLVPGTYFGAVSWVTGIVFAIGLFVNFFSIPYLYFSSYQSFVNENDFWDKETFWILPLFFFGTFFIYGSEFPSSLNLLLISLGIIASIHFKFFLTSRKFIDNSNQENVLIKEQYFLSLKYLTVYYLILLVLLVLYNPLQQVFVWIRMNV